MTPRRSVPRSLAQYVARTGFFYVLAIMALAFTRVSVAQQATILNPRSGETITSLTSVDLTQLPPALNPGINASYVLNGTCHNADKVLITIVGTGNATGASVASAIATVKGGVWEYLWTFPQQDGMGIATAGPCTITVTPQLNGVGTPLPSVPITLSAAVPGIALSLVPSGVINHIYAGAGNASGGVQPLGVRLRYFSTAAAPIGNLQFRDLLGQAKSTYFAPANVLTINNDDPAGNQQNNGLAPSNVVPFSFTLGGAGGLTDGINTVVVSNGAVSAQRSVIVDYTPPIVTGLIGFKFLSQNTVQFSGTVHDILNGLGTPQEAPGGIASVELVVLPPGAGAKAQHVHAKLVYGANPSDDVNWTADFNTTTPGNYTAYAIVSDNAGNQKIDTAAPIAIDSTPPTLSITPKIVFLNGKTQPINFSVLANTTLNATGIPANLDVNYELHALPAIPNPLDTLIAMGLMHGGLDVMGIGTLSAIWDTTQAVDGPYNLYLNAVDAQKNPATSKGNNVLVYVDNTAPTITFTSPAAKAYLKGATNAIKATVTDNIIATGNDLTVVSLKDDAGNDLTSSVVPIGMSGSLTITANYNVTTISEGMHTLTLIVKDKAGNESDPTLSTTKLVVFVKNKAPVVGTITASPTLSKSTTVGVSGTITDGVTDPTNILTYQIFDGAAVLGTYKGVPNLTFNHSITLAEGTHAIKVVATDPANNLSNNSNIVSVLVDTTNPIASINQIQRTKVVDATMTPPTLAADPLYTITGRAVNEIVTAYSDKVDPMTMAITIAGVKEDLTISGTYNETNLTALSVQVDGVNVPTTFDAGTFTATIDTTTYKDGRHVLSVIATDAVGNVNDVTSTDVSLIVENIYPNVLLTTPSNNTAVPVGTPIVGTITAGVDYLKILANSSDPTIELPDPSAASTATMTLKLLNGTGTVIATDTRNIPAVNGLFSISVPDNILGTSTISTTEIPVKLQITLTGSDRAKPVHTVSSAPITLTVLQSSVTIDEIDHSGFLTAAQPASSTITVAPVPDPIYVSGTLSVFGTVGIASLDNWVLALGGGGLASTIPIGTDRQPLSATTKLNKAPYDPFNTAATNPALPGNPRITPDGSYTLTLTAKTTATPPSVTTATRTVIIDNKVPDVVFTTPTPAEGAFVPNKAGALLTISGTITEANPSQWFVLIDGAQLDAVPLSHGTGLSVSFTPTATASNSGSYLAEGPHTIEIVALDKAGNKGTSGPRHITVINTPPTVKITAPTDGQFIKGTFHIAGTITDNVLAYLKTYTITDTFGGVKSTLKIDNSGSTAPFYDWPTSGDGDHMLTLTATDVAGNTSDPVSSVTVTVGNTVPTIKITKALRTATTSTATNYTPSPFVDDYSLGATDAKGAATMAVPAVRDTVTFSGTFTVGISKQFDPTLVVATLDNTQVDLKTAALDTPSAITGKFSLDIDTTQYGDGQHILRISIKDKSGNASAGSSTNLVMETFMVDNTPPNILINTPALGQTIAVTVPVIGTVSSAHPGTDAYFAFILHTAPWNTPPLGDFYTLYNTPPTSTLLSNQYIILKANHQPGSLVYSIPFPAKFKDGSFIPRGTAIDIRLFADDVTVPSNRGVSPAVNVVTASGQAASIDRFSEYDGDAPPAANGVYYLHSAQYDRDGNYLGKQPISIIGTVNVPSLQKYTINVRQNNVVIKSYTETNSSGQAITVKSILNPTTGNGFDTTVLREGAYTIDITAIDLGGATFQLPKPTDSSIPFPPLASIIVDNTPAGLDPGYDVSHNPIPTTPAPDPTLVAPINFIPLISGHQPDGDFLKNGSYTVSGNVSDNIALTSNVLTTQLLLDGSRLAGPFMKYPTNTPYVKWDVSSVTEGKHVLTITSQDLARNTSSKSITVTVDRTPPKVTFNFPTDGQFVSGNLDIKATITDNITDPNNQLQAKLNIVSVATGATYSLTVPYEKVQPGVQSVLGSWNTTNPLIPNGDYLISVSAMDAAGNKSEDSGSLPQIKVTVVNGPLSQQVDLGLGTFVDQFGGPLSASYNSSSPASTFSQTRYTQATSYSLKQVLSNATSSTITEVVNGVVINPVRLTRNGVKMDIPAGPSFYSGIQTQSVTSILAPFTNTVTDSKTHMPTNTAEGRFQTQLTAGQNTVSNDGIHSDALFLPVDVVVDGTSPTVTLTTPQSGAGNIAAVAPGGLLTVTFTVENTPGTVTIPKLTKLTQDQIAPLKKVPQPNNTLNPFLDVPFFTLAIRELPTLGFDPAKSINTGDLTKYYGKLTVANQGSGLYKLVWQIPIQSQYFAYGQIYTVVIDGVQDIVGNHAPGDGSISGTQSYTVKFKVLN